MDDGDYEGSVVELMVSPMEMIRQTEANARNSVEFGLYTCKRLEGFAKQIASAFSSFSSHLYTICAEERTRTNKIARDAAVGATELWAVLQSLTIKIAESEASSAAGLLADFVQPLEEMQIRLLEQKKSLDSLKKDAIDVTSMEVIVRKEKRLCLKGFKSLQNSVKGLSTGSENTSRGVFSRMAKSRLERGINKKIVEVQELFKKYEHTINTFNDQLKEYETKIQIPVLLELNQLEDKRMQLLNQCAKQLRSYLCNIMDSDNATSLLVDNVVNSLERGQANAQRNVFGTKHKLCFSYDLPCRPQAFDEHSWPGCSYQFWNSACQTSKTKSDENRCNSFSRTVLSEGMESDESLEHVHETLTTDDNDFEPAPKLSTFEFIHPKIASTSNSEGDLRFVSNSSKALPFTTGNVSSSGRIPSDTFNQKLQLLETVLSKPGQRRPSALMQPISGIPVIKKQELPTESSSDLSHATLTRPAVAKYRRRRQGDAATIG